MSKYICSCRTLYGDRKSAFELGCKQKGHTLLEVADEIYAFIYDLKEDNSSLRERVKKRNRNIVFLENRISKLESELKILRA